VWSNSKQFVVKAGTTIFAMSVILWALAYYPRLPASRAHEIRVATLPDAAARVFHEDSDVMDHAMPPENTAEQRHAFGEAALSYLRPGEAKEVDEIVDNAVAAAQSEYSLAGRFGHTLEPIIRPLGYDWKMGVGLVAAFAARETFVSTEGIIYATGGDTDSGTDTLQKAMQDAKYANGKPVWTPLVAVSLLIWFVLAMQCMSTVAIVKRETGGWGWPIFMTVYMNGLAYVLCLIVFQVGAHVFHL
jgi:ferrous iron transport protein B